MDFWTRTLWTIKSNELMRKLFEINGNLYRTIQQPEGVDKRFEFVGTIMDVDKVMQVIDSVMVIPPAVQELIKDKLKEL